MALRTSITVFLSTTLLGGAALLAGCDDSTDGSGGASSSTGSTATSMTNTTGASMTTSGSSMGTGSSTSTGGGGVTQSEWDAYCDARAGLNCMGFDVAACKMQFACATGLLRDDIEKDLLMCAQMGCSTDNCLAVGVAKPLSAVGMEFQTACNNYKANCPGVGDDECSYPFLLADSELSEALPCFSMGNCPMKQMCLENYNDTNTNVCEDWL